MSVQMPTKGSMIQDPEVLQLIGHAMAELGRTVYASRVLLQVPDSCFTGYACVCALKVQCIIPHSFSTLSLK